LKVKKIIYEDFNDYKFPSMFIAFPSCTFKCEKECSQQICQNNELVNSPNIEIDIKTIVNRYINNPLTNSIVCGGLEPFDSWKDLLDLVKYLRKSTNDDIVIFTGFNYDEIKDKITLLKQFPNIIVKFGRFIPNQEQHFDKILGVYLASDNQFSERIS